MTKSEDQKELTRLAVAVERNNQEILAMRESTTKAVDALVVDLNRHEEILFGDGDQVKGLLYAVRQNTEHRESVQSETTWFRRAVVGAIVTIVIAMFTGCVKLDELATQMGTISPPQQTAIALNATYRAEMTEMAHVMQPTPTATATVEPGHGGGAPLDEPTPTPGIEEAPPIVEFGTPIAASTLMPNVIIPVRGKYESTDGEGQYVYRCPRTTCDIVRWLWAGHKVDVFGWLVDAQHRIWRCLDYYRYGLATLTRCNEAVLNVDGPKTYGSYTVLPD